MQFGFQIAAFIILYVKHDCAIGPVKKYW